MNLGLGIDAGGTYTDSVLLDFETGEVVNKAKALTTHHNLAEGIANSVRRLERRLLPMVQICALSTTLATNSIVEGRGASAGLLLLGYDDYAVQQVGFAPVCRVRGRIDITGEELEPLDEDGVHSAVASLVEEHRVQAVAISGMCSVMNPVHELRAAQIVRQIYPGLPVVCGHDLSLELDAIRRARTAALNSRLIPVIAHLMAATKRVLADFGVLVPLMVVRGDGSLMTEEAAMRRPVETILSGPAASVVGARFLTGLDDAVVVDMGGTTTDIAVVSGGQPEINPRGATVGGRPTSVKAADIRTCGLGGDSHIRVKGNEVLVGPSRAVPLAFAAQEYPNVLAQLDELGRIDASPLIQPCDFLVLIRPDAEPTGVSGTERAVLDLLSGGPMSVWHLAKEVGLMHPALLSTSRLEECGAVRRAALTPTDVLHFTGEMDTWCREASEKALELYARRLGVDAQTVCRMVWERVKRISVSELLCKVDPRLDGGHGSRAYNAVLNGLLSDSDGGMLRWRVSLDRPLVAVGAPAAVWLKPAASVLGAKLVVPPHSEVANAVGAVTGTLVFSSEARITLDSDGAFVVHSALCMTKHASLEEAKRRAVADVEQVLASRLREEGMKGVEFQTAFDVKDEYASVGDGQRMYVETRVVGKAVGKPAFSKNAESGRNG